MQPGERWKLAAYGRTSKDDPKTVTIEIQQTGLRRWAGESADVELIDQYWDPGISGLIPLGERPEGRRLIEDVRAGRVNSVAVLYADRFGRTLLDGLLAVRELETCGTKLVCVNEGWDARRMDSPIYMQFRFMLAEEDHRTIRRRMDAGKLRAIERDNAPPGGPLTFGYRMDKHGRFVLDPVEGPLVLEIFSKYLRGESCAAILRWLMTAGVKPGQKFQKRGTDKVTIRSDHEHARWDISTVGNILRNPTYLGVRRWGKREFPCTPLIDQESFSRVEVMLNNKATGTNKSDPEKSLLSGLFRCGLCGGKFFRHTSRMNARRRQYEYYQCENTKLRKPGQKYCRAKSIPISWLDQHVWQTFEQYLRDPEELIRQLLSTDATRTQQADDVASSLKDAKSKLAGLVDRVQELWDQQTARDWPLSWIAPQLDLLNAERRALEAETKTLQQRHAAITFKQADSSQVMAEVARMRAMLDKGLTRRQQSETIRQAWADGVVHTIGEGRQRTADIHFEFKWGALAVSPLVGWHQCQPSMGETGASPPQSTPSFTIRVGRIAAIA